MTEPNRTVDPERFYIRVKQYREGVSMAEAIEATKREGIYPDDPPQEATEWRFLAPKWLYIGLAIAMLLVIAILLALEFFLAATKGRP